MSNQTPKNGSFWTVGKNCPEADFNSTDPATDRSTIQEAIDVAESSDRWKDVHLLAGSYKMDNQPLMPKNHVTLRGVGKDAVQFIETPAYGWAISNHTGNMNDSLEHFILSNVTINLSLLNSSGVGLSNASNCTIEQCRVFSTSNGGWHVKIGTQEHDKASSEITSFDNSVRDCSFTDHEGTLEQLLLFNAKNTYVANCLFKNNRSSISPALAACLGLWQWTLNTKIEGCSFINNASQCIYYSVTCNDTVVSDCYFENCGPAIHGANVSDWGNYGYNRVYGLTLSRLRIIGGENSEKASAVIINGVDGYFIGNGTSITGYALGIKLCNKIVVIGSDGNNITQVPNPINGIIAGVRIFNNNAENINHEIHPGIIFASENKQIWQDFYNLIISNCQIYDSRPVKQQKYAVSFEGEFAHPIIKVRINACCLSGEGGASIRVPVGTDISKVEVIYPTDWTFNGEFPGKLVVV